MDTFISTTKLILILTTLILVADAEDVVCGMGETTKNVMIGEGDSYSFKTQDGDMYAPNINCFVTYQRKKDCPMIKLTCSQFNINNKDSYCEKGDKMIVEDVKKRESYCQTSAPDVTTSSTFLWVSFYSDKKGGRQALGAVCTVQCTVKPNTATTTTTTTTLEADTTTTITDLSKGNSLKLFNCNNTNLGNSFLDATTPGSGLFCMAYDDRLEPVSKTSYNISVDLLNYQSKSGPESGRLGLAFNFLDANNYEGLYIRINATSKSKCVIQRFKITNGISDFTVKSDCFGGPKGRTWFSLKVAVDNQKKEAKVYINGIPQNIGNGKNLNVPVMPRGGVIVANGYKNMAFFKNFQIVKI